MKKIIILLAVVAFLAGCTVRTSVHPGGGFCPPGQAKKGRC